MYGKEIAKVLVSREEIAKRVKELAAEINRDYAGKPLMVVCILRGATIFFADLFRELTGDVEVDFIAVSSTAAEWQVRAKSRCSRTSPLPWRANTFL